MQNWIRVPQQTLRFKKSGQPEQSSSELEDKAWTFWETMGEIYSSLWTNKNGSAPSDLWIAQVGNLNNDQMMSICNALISRCKVGNSWPPSLAEFIALVADAGIGQLGLRISDIMAEYTCWRNESYRYDCAELFPWRHPVLYHICTELRRTGVENQMTYSELEALAGKLLAKWENHMAEGKDIPPIRKQLVFRMNSDQPTPAQTLLRKYKQRKDAGLI